MATHWNAFDRKLIEYVSQQPFIHKGRITPTNPVVWSKFSTMVGVPEKKCAKRWAEIRNFYKICTNAIKTKRISKNKLTSVSKYFDGSLAFLGSPELILKRDQSKTTVSNESKLETEKDFSKEETETKNQTEKHTLNNDLLSKTTIVTQEMIEELIKLKSIEESNETASSSNAPATYIPNTVNLATTIQSVENDDNLEKSHMETAYDQEEVDDKTIKAENECINNDIAINKPDVFIIDDSDDDVEMSVVKPENSDNLTQEAEVKDELASKSIVFTHETLSDTILANDRSKSNTLNKMSNKRKAEDNLTQEAEIKDELASESIVFTHETQSDTMLANNRSKSNTPNKISNKRKAEEIIERPEALKGILYHHDMGTEQFFEEIGEYISKNFPEKKQKELRLMIWSLITNEELALLQEE